MTTLKPVNARDIARNSADYHASTVGNCAPAWGRILPARKLQCLGPRHRELCAEHPRYYFGQCSLEQRSTSP